ncbi:hypothetical protein [Halorubrum vacuolatum]|uniref:Uncharacterized protein n=1 Tax=Halorubrum vacuolatum TaxID=63740 RepID=A0A238WQA0_HALVU|nr:hypothetical protein [Halorubrum vacuolatum]SNR48780.1 hypothetical protein SAMN06264855_10976 [Halorubrum vacuolatum]
MFRSIREHGPALLVPAAWTVAAAAVAGLVSTQALFIMHVVMSLFLVAFVLTGWREMSTGVLAGWRAVILAGVPITLAGVAGLSLTTDALLAVALYGWALLPAAGFIYTAGRVDVGRWIYLAGAACCPVGALVVALAPSTTVVVAGIALIGVGQTAGILDATLRY